ncbi:MAG: hypothetical protein FWC11_00885 [Firmicutes bacterium]|nr:hypothetical protein [Bacillota bacterium]MCL2255397.1 hypothetical protein [Bacillota bacterium]
MFEYEVLRFTRERKQFEKEVELKRGKTTTETYVQVELIEDFFERIKQTLNYFGNEGWQVVSTNYAMPIQGNVELSVGNGFASYSETDWNEVEFVATLQRNKID